MSERKSTYALVLSLYGNFIIGQPSVLEAAKACMSFDSVTNRRTLLVAIYDVHVNLVGSSLSPCLVLGGPPSLVLNSDYAEILDEMFASFVKGGAVGSLNAIATFTLSALDARMELDMEECSVINAEYAARRKEAAPGPQVASTLLVDQHGNNLAEDPAKLIIRS